MKKNRLAQKLVLVVLFVSNFDGYRGNFQTIIKFFFLDGHF